jgi:hypothetical protein
MVRPESWTPSRSDVRRAVATFSPMGALRSAGSANPVGVLPPAAGLRRRRYRTLLGSLGSSASPLARAAPPGLQRGVVHAPFVIALTGVPPCSRTAGRRRSVPWVARAIGAGWSRWRSRDPSLIPGSPISA